MGNDQGVALGAERLDTTALGLLGDALPKLFGNLSRDLWRAQVVPPAVKAVRVTVTKFGEPAGSRAPSKQHVRPHCAPTQTRPGPNGRIDVLDTGNAFVDQMDRFSPKRGLQAVGDVTGNLFVNANGDFTHLTIKGLCIKQRGRVRPLVANDFDQWHQMGRVERVTKDEPRRVSPSSLHFLDHQPRGRRRNNSVRFQVRLDAPVKIQLDR